MSLKWILLPTVLFLVMASVIAVVGAGGGRMASLDGQTIKSVPKPKDPPLAACGNCAWFNSTNQYWYSNSLNCYFGSGASMDGYANQYTITAYQCSTGYCYVCYNTAPGPCYAPANSEPLCPNGTCTGGP